MHKGATVTDDDDDFADAYDPVAAPDVPDNVQQEIDAAIEADAEAYRAALIESVTAYEAAQEAGGHMP